MHANIHVVKMIVETAQLLCNVHHRAREICLPPYISRRRIPYKESAAGHRKLGSMIWVTESLGNYRWAVQLGLALCDEYNRGRGRAAGKTTLHSTQKVLEWLRDHEPQFEIQRRTPVKLKHLAMPDRYKKMANSVEAYRAYYWSKRKTMEMKWPTGKTPLWWECRQNPKKRKEVEKANKKKAAMARKKQKVSTPSLKEDSTGPVDVPTLQEKTSDVPDPVDVISQQVGSENPEMPPTGDAPAPTGTALSA